MAIFKLTDTDGVAYKVEADTPEQAHAAFKKMQGGASGDNPLAPTEEQAFAAQLGTPGPSWDDIKSLPGRFVPSGNVEGFKAGVGELINHPSRAAETLPGQLAVGAVHGLASGATAAGDAATGKMPVFDPYGQPTDEAIRRGVDMSMFGPGRLNPAERRVPPAVPTQEELRAAATQGYNAVRDSGVDYHSAAVTRNAADWRRALEEQGILESAAPKTYEILRGLEVAPPNSVAPIHYLDAARKGLRTAGRDFNNPTDQLAAGIVKDGIDKFIAAADPETVVAGPAADAGAALVDARGNTAARKRSEQITDLEYKGLLKAGASHSGANGDNAIRQRAVEILTDKKKRAGYSPEEIASLEEVAMGDRVRNGTRWVGNFLGGGGGLGAFLTTMGSGVAGASATGNMWGAAAAGAPLAVGITAKQLGAKMTAKALRESDELVRKRSPLYEERLQGAGVQEVTPELRAALARALMGGAVQPDAQ